MADSEEDLLSELSLYAFVNVKNRFQWFFATPETTIWVVTVEHCNRRGKSFTHEGQNLKEVLQEAMKSIEAVNELIAAEMKVNDG